MMCFVLLNKTALATKPFQGTVTYSVVTDEEKGTISMASKGQKVKMEPHFGDSNGKVWMVINNSTQEMTIVMPEKYMYMTMTLNMMKTMGKKAMPGLLGKEEKTFDQKPQSTGKTKTILGHKCHQYIMNDDGDHVEMWVAHDLGVFPQMMGMPIPQYIGKEDFAFFPLEINGKDKDGETFSLTVTELKTTTPADDAFVPPSSYQKINMGGR